MSQAVEYNFSQAHKERLAGEITFFNIKAEFGQVQLVKASFLGLDDYQGRFGLGGFLVRYNNVLDTDKDYVTEYGIWEFLPFRLSFVPFFKKGEFWHRGYGSRGDRFLFWNSVSMGQYAKFYTRFFAEASCLKFISRWRDPEKATAYRFEPEPVSKYRKIGRMYPATFTVGGQISYSLLAIEAGYIYQLSHWDEFYKNGFFLSHPDGFSFTGPYVSLNLSLGGILIGPSNGE